MTLRAGVEKDLKELDLQIEMIENQNEFKRSHVYDH